jgi:proteasome lid subunit RPN8/RPN11
MDDFACSVRISALALLKMAMHAKSGGNLEVMGMLYGKIQDDTFIVIDAFALPVEGTETRINAQAEAYEFMVEFAESGKVTCHAVHLLTYCRARFLGSFFLFQCSRHRQTRQCL